MKFLLALIFLTTPLAASAHTGLEGTFAFIYILFITVVPLSTTAFSLYLLRRRSPSLLLLVDIIFSVIYAILLNFGFSRSSFTGDELWAMMSVGLPVADIPVGIIPVFLFFAVIFRIFASIVFSKQDAPNLNKVFLHLIITGAITILFTFSFAHGAVRILYSTNCDKNLILNSYDRGKQGYNCIVNTAVERIDPEFCNKFADNSNAIRYCKLQVNIKKVESGDFSGCDYLRSSAVNDFFQPNLFEREGKIISQCRSDPNTFININAYIKVLSPNGGEVWTKGRAYDIRWTSKNIPDGTKFKISLIQFDTKIERIISDRGGAYNNLDKEITWANGWIIPSDISAGSYMVSITAPGITATKVADVSDAPFSIE